MFQHILFIEKSSCLNKQVPVEQLTDEFLAEPAKEDKHTAAAFSLLIETAAVSLELVLTQ